MPEVSKDVPSRDNMEFEGEPFAQRGAGTTADITNDKGSCVVSGPEMQPSVHGDANGELEVSGVSPAEIDAYNELKSVAKTTMSAQNEFLGRLLTLDTALLGGGLVLAKGEVLPHWWAVATMFSLFVSLGSCLYGLAPYKFLISDSSLQSYVDYLNTRETISESKQLMTKIAAYAFASALAVGVLGTVAKGLTLASFNLNWNL